MKKAIALLTTIVAIFLVWFLASARSNRINAAEDPSTEEAKETIFSPGSHPRMQEGSRPVPTVKLNAALLNQESAEDRPPPRAEERVRSDDYERLMARQGRDPSKEMQLLGRLTEVFADRSDTSIGEVACSAEFCRVELRANGKIENTDKHWQKDLFSAVEPKGLKFFVVAEDDAGNTLETCYFGRSDAWKAPDFAPVQL
jgi:hypothetical protein